MATYHLLYKDFIPVGDRIKVRIPKLREIIEKEDEYFGMVSIFTATPYDFMAELDDIGIDFTELNEFDLFMLLSIGLAESDTSLLFEDLDFSLFKRAVNEQNGNLVLIDREHDIVIDRGVLAEIAMALRKIHHIEPSRKKPGNEEAKKYMIERARKKRARNRKRNAASQLEQLIVALVNTEQFKYNYESVLDLSIYQFNESVAQVVTKIDYDNRMHGVYAGTVDIKHMSQDDLTWLSHK